MFIYVFLKECGFPLAEERIKRKTFFSHTAGSLGSGVRGCLGHMVCARYSFVCCHLPLPSCNVHLLILLVSFTLSQLLAKLQRSSSGCVNKGQVVWFGLAWLPVVCETRILRSYKAK